MDTTQGIFGKASDTDSESEFSLACRDRRGKHRKNRQDSLKDKHSGIKDKCSEVVVKKQLYPHATLQQEFLWGWDGNGIEYKDLTFGLFVAGELEIILSDLTNKQECKQRLDMLRLTAYRSQYVKWQKLLHLHAAIIRKIESGLATWDSNFDQVEKMVLENPGKADWGSWLGMRKGASGIDNKPSGPLRRGDAGSTANRGKWWCREFQSGTCSKSAPHTKNIRGREMIVKHICAKCFQKDGAEHAHGDRDPVWKSPQTVQNYISGVRVLHLLSDQPLDAFVSPDLKLTLKGVLRIKLHQPCQAQPVTLDMLLAMEEFVDKSSPTEVVLWTAILIAFFCLLRKSNYVVDTEKDFDSRKQLCRRDVSVGQDCLLVDIKWSKTIQFGQHSFQIPVLAIPESKLCPVALYRRMIQIVKAGPEDPAFCLQGKQGPQPVRYALLQSYLKGLVRLAGWDPYAFSSHSLRRGGGGQGPRRTNSSTGGLGK